MAEARKIRLSVTGIQYPPPEELEHMPAGEREQSAVVTRTEAAAEYRRRGDSHYFFYEEQPDGFAAPVKTRIKCREGFLEMVRQGGMDSRMVFEPGKTHRTEYSTPFGKLFLDVTAESVALEAGEEACPRVRADYTLENAGQCVGTYRLMIEEI